MKVFAKSTIRHDGETFNKGDQLPENLNENQVSELVAAGVVDVESEKPVKPAKTEDVRKQKADKQAESDDIKTVANLPLNKKMTKERLTGIARANGLEVEKTAVVEEIYNMIQDHRGENKDSKKDNKPTNPVKA